MLPAPKPLLVPTLNPRLHLFVLVALSGTLFLINLGGFDLWPPDEPRFAQVAREMVRSGDYLVPRVNGLPYKEKPPLLFWTQAIFATPFGDVTEWPARLPSALSGVIVVVLTYLLVARLRDHRTAFWAGLILASSQRFWWQARFGQIDMLLTACLTAAFLFFWLWHMDRRKVHLTAFYLAIAAGVFAKGPPALIFPLLMVLCFYWKRRDDRKQLHLISGLTFVGLLAALWLVPARMAVSAETSIATGDEIASGLFRQTIGRFFLGVAHAQAPWYYLLQLPMDLFPWSLFLPWTLLWTWRYSRSGEAMSFLLSWIVPAFIFFSVCMGKRALYLLPLHPALAALFAMSILALMDGQRIAWRKRTSYAWGIILIVIGLVPLALPFTEFKADWDNSLLIVSVCALSSGLISLWSSWRTDARSLPRLMLGQFSLLLILVAVIGFPLMNPHKSAKQFCAPLRELAHKQVDYDLYSVAFTSEEYIYYADHFHQTIPTELLVIAGVDNQSPLEQPQLEWLRAIQKAVAQVDIESIAAVSEKDMGLLREAIEDAVPDEGDDARDSHGLRDAMVQALNELMERTSLYEPAFVMVQAQDWRWVLALCPEARSLTLINDESVGSRRVLLFANTSGARLAEPASTLTTNT